MELIKLSNVYFKYDEDWILENVNLNIKEKEFLGIVGPNGGGKTTLLKIILGLLKPSSGTVNISGVMSYVPQHLIFEKNFPISVTDVVLMGLVDRLEHGIYHCKSNKEKVITALERLNISDLALKKFGELSGGQRQRVLIARAIINDPDILILDEPTANIDKLAQENVQDLLKTLNKTVTILMVSHQFDFITSDVNRVICIDRKLHTHSTKTLEGQKLVLIDHSNDKTERNKI